MGKQPTVNHSPKISHRKSNYDCRQVAGCHCCLVAKLHLSLCDTTDCSLPGSSVHGFPRKEYCKGLPVPSPMDLPDSGIKLESPALHVDYLPVSHWGIVNHSPKIIYGMSNYIVDFKSYIPLQLHLFVFYHLFRAKLTCLFFYKDFLVPFNYNYIHLFSTVLTLRWVRLKMFFYKR